eukprot:TRINITY_DN11746_c0_g1_i9.p1 TRINITY_DN11746_c0_g1~~TRINITY_DN11746_c0_g1_i9.p1  ORF type:complete len:398 (+),score=21.79 TRINITY_DN11746_c0_g1_i9:160-1353(+)
MSSLSSVLYFSPYGDLFSSDREPTRDQIVFPAFLSGWKLSFQHLRRCIVEPHPPSEVHGLCFKVPLVQWKRIVRQYRCFEAVEVQVTSYKGQVFNVFVLQALPQYLEARPLVPDPHVLQRLIQLSTTHQLDADYVAFLQHYPVYQVHSCHTYLVGPLTFLYRLLIFLPLLLLYSVVWLLDAVRHGSCDRHRYAPHVLPVFSRTSSQHSRMFAVTSAPPNALSIHLPSPSSHHPPPSPSPSHTFPSHTSPSHTSPSHTSPSHTSPSHTSPSHTSPTHAGPSPAQSPSPSHLHVQAPRPSPCTHPLSSSPQSHSAFHPTHHSSPSPHPEPDSLSHSSSPSRSSFPSHSIPHSPFASHSPSHSSPSHSSLSADPSHSPSRQLLAYSPPQFSAQHAQQNMV